MTTPWTASVLTTFAGMFPGPLGHSLPGKALAAGLWALDVVNLREFATDRHQTVDDTPFGGGAGMVMRADVAAAAVDSLAGRGPDRPRVYLSPRGSRLDQSAAAAFARAPGLIALCGRFEGVDERVLEARGFAELSIGDFVLAGGEVAAMCLIEAVVRLLPGVVGAPASLAEESFAAGLLEYPHYTRPREWEGRRVPDVLLSGHHAKISAWRREQALSLTKRRRPDLLPPCRSADPSHSAVALEPE